MVRRGKRKCSAEGSRKFLSTNSFRRTGWEHIPSVNILQIRFIYFHLILLNDLHHTGKFDVEAWQYWDTFYRMHQVKFFKDRRWLFLEFPELLPPSAKSRATNRCLGDQQPTCPLPSGSRANTETRHQQHNGPTHHYRSTDASNNLESSQGSGQDKDGAAIKTFLGQHASFRILEVVKTFQMYCSVVWCRMLTIA